MFQYVCVYTVYECVQFVRVCHLFVSKQPPPAVSYWEAAAHILGADISSVLNNHVLLDRAHHTPELLLHQLCGHHLRAEVRQCFTILVLIQEHVVHLKAKSINLVNIFIKHIGHMGDEKSHTYTYA